MTVSAGVSLAPFDGDSTNQLIKFAEIAKSFANKEGAGSFRYFKQELNDQVTRNFSLARDLRKALKEEKLEVYYQPKISLVDVDFPAERDTAAAHGFIFWMIWRHQLL